ncbi:MAG: polyprenol phosphomannose-dependent alpha 1,6 mannosyltransferase MptB, partial [Pseudonocardiales bacterium]|nr:polyprenol phosphomannose-dependent alpha 1,6 mannosyltransferase MptB [Pseudonocardiales bacterium]
MDRVMSASAPVDPDFRSEPSPIDAHRTARFGNPPRRPLLLGLLASVMLLVGGFGAGGVLVRDPLMTNSPIGFWRYGHGHDLASTLMYGGVGLMAWAWIMLGRDVLGNRVASRAVLTTAAVWIAPLLLAPPLFTRDIFSYLAQGALPLHGFDPYAVGPDAMPGILADNVHYFWQDTPAPYGPLFIIIAKAVAWLIGNNIIAGVLLMRLALLPGLALLVWALPELTRRLGGRVPLALWIVVANPMMVITMIGGGHNDLLVVGLLAAGSLLALRGRHAGGIALVTLAMAVKASAGLALPFLVLVWAADMTGTLRVRIAKATAAGIAVFVIVFGVCTLVAGVDLGWLPALSAPSMIVNWMSIPTALGQIFGWIASLFGGSMQLFINIFRALGAALLLWIAVRQWWAAREGGPDAIRRAGIVLFATAILSPATLPWYVSWGMALLAMAPWTVRGLQYMVVVALMLIIVYYPNGEDGLYNWAYLGACLAVAVLAAWSLVHPDPLRLAAGARSRATPVPDTPSPATASTSA